ncbi:hypothetical protein LBMAG44_05880 [Gemmatimonadota bacterium]|nr:hypothetical protein LBMAG44_05880 [Gemmatimonadota bacterium]
MHLQPNGPVLDSFRLLRARASYSTIVAVLAFHAALAQAEAQALPEAKSLMEKHNAAVGGRAALDKYSSMRLTATMSVAAMGMEASMEVFRAKPNKYVQKIVLPQIGEILQGYDGTVAWTTNPMAGAQLITGEALEAAKSNGDFFANLQDPANYTKAETIELSDFEGRKCYKVKVARGTRDGFEYFDAGTGLLAGISGAQATPQGPIEATTVFVEYGDFGGLRLPKKIEQRGGPAGATITFTAVEFDKVDAATFDLPAAVKALVKP